MSILIETNQTWTSAHRTTADYVRSLQSINGADIHVSIIFNVANSDTSCWRYVATVLCSSNTKWSIFPFGRRRKWVSKKSASCQKKVTKSIQCDLFPFGVQLHSKWPNKVDRPTPSGRSFNRFGEHNRLKNKTSKIKRTLIPIPSNKPVKFK